MMEWESEKRSFRVMQIEMRVAGKSGSMRLSNADI